MLWLLLLCGGLIIYIILVCRPFLHWHSIEHFASRAKLVLKAQNFLKQLLSVANFARTSLAHQRLNASLSLLLRVSDLLQDFLMLYHALYFKVLLLQKLEIFLAFLALITHKLHLCFERAGKVVLLFGVASFLLLRHRLVRW